MFTVLVDRPGSTAVELTPRADSVQFATAAVGGFGDASFSVDGIQTQLLPYMATVRIMYGTQIVYEGRIEDRSVSIRKDDIATDLTCFGLQRLFSDNSVRRIWSLRNIDWGASVRPPGASVGTGGSSMTRTDLLAVATGHFDRTDLSKAGVQVSGTGQAVSSLLGEYGEFYLPSGLTIAQVLFSFVLSGANTGVTGMWGFKEDMGSDGTVLAFDAASYQSSNASAGGSAAANTAGIRLGMVNPQGVTVTPTAADIAQFYDIRVLGTSMTEDATGGYYGDTILRDLIALCPGLTAGVIESGSDFTIQAIERAIRGTCLSVVQEVASYYAREWAVWESGRFDWRTPNLDQAQWIVSLKDCDQLDIEGSLDTHTKTAYVLYTDAASGIDAEASAASTSQRNPFVKTGAVKDDLTSAGFPMTSNTSSQLASRVAASRGQFPPITGRVVIPAGRLLSNAVGSRLPAALIRAGTNVLIPELPKTDLLGAGRDGETLFHIVSTEVNMEEGTVTLELEGQGREIDVITARLAAATRVLTG